MKQTFLERECFETKTWHLNVNSHTCGSLGELTWTARLPDQHLVAAVVTGKCWLDLNITLAFSTGGLLAQIYSFYLSRLNHWNLYWTEVIFSQKLDTWTSLSSINGSAWCEDSWRRSEKAVFNPHSRNMFNHASEIANKFWHLLYTHRYLYLFRTDHTLIFNPPHTLLLLSGAKGSPWAKILM